jgi:hypothetical protein
MITLPTFIELTTGVYMAEITVAWFESDFKLMRYSSIAYQGSYFLERAIRIRTSAFRLRLA